MRKTLLLLVPTLLLGACTWGITLDDAAKGVRTAWNGDVSSCQDLGKVTVSVASRVGPVNRNDITVRDELEVMARNEAAKMNADTIKPLSEPAEGSQPWGVYKCGAKLPASSRTPANQPVKPASQPAGNAETFPVKGN
ncbi:DUF4156 domain-containing protein [Dyella tabacisoli]|uniref:DUF4156 domain-containing protein n=1 Tax=Dyella tabacisoli TaxID=2282381 RepID=A0A369UNL6_9GAMM|nr:DUF4156 domain-containing protein [Dyella tabacisoli]RDD82236.1 DUF4156 domain-containing protein [Dyella tabacisoli]